MINLKLKFVFLKQRNLHIVIIDDQRLQYNYNICIKIERK